MEKLSKREKKKVDKAIKKVLKGFAKELKKHPEAKWVKNPNFKE